MDSGILSLGEIIEELERIATELEVKSEWSLAKSIEVVKISLIEHIEGQI